ncbi:MAG: hypothetical protein HS132_06970 [Planctomycetia bacterium]|nr:hypothetical protein [Planctomycetia bacterium]
MSTLSILPYFPFQRVRITKQTVFSDAEISQLTAVPDERFHPIYVMCVVAKHSAFIVTTNDLCGI